ncbi:hypothetical protein SIAM614_00707 [Stappia aggregata IAM 12614]|uniref:Uncharacterized protein n=1 Tax=Roseibium aggregatum (strain ATCC 25650 / DSM 13394 / JCM 20685 / NBRC 16684 / NCIMB 2208 / IAM 12614 / B1) TaxID=384765 RepID=A0P2R4_ROSAI|nr:hypothetical protein SIAM614_00707 [Stappia aggregata IAM 12614] [Roseibium aggregatum IAM 12614]
MGTLRQRPDGRVAGDTEEGRASAGRHIPPPSSPQAMHFNTIVLAIWFEPSVIHLRKALFWSIKRLAKARKTLASDSLLRLIRQVPRCQIVQAGRYFGVLSGMT